MKIEIAKHERMSQSGSSLLRLIQNNEMPTLDLLVREAVQNSTDASLTGGGFVGIDFNTGKFESSRLRRHFEGIEPGLKKRFGEGQYDFMELRDYKTTGLKGPLEYKDVQNNNFGNLLKLVYEISMPQQEEGSGGSWGLGKTVYFRIGIGLVVYYSRIKDADGQHNSRLAACLVEDEEKEDVLISYSGAGDRRGIAWWGQRGSEPGRTMPLTDELEIERVLSDLGVEPYTGGETGTSIIIPYVDSQKLLGETIPSSDEERLPAPKWTDSIEKYVSVALQRWYAPRLGNENFKTGRWIKARVNKKPVASDKMLPAFKAFQELYNFAQSGTTSESDGAILSGKDVKKEEIAVRKVFLKGQKTGEVVFVKLSRSDLKMTAPNNHSSPFIQIGRGESVGDLNHPILAYIRKPGMVVSYETVGNWVDGIPKTDPEEFLLALFVPNSGNVLGIGADNLTLEEYLRKGEKADHTSWNDWNIGSARLQIVSKMQRRIKDKIASEYAPKEKPEEQRRNAGLGRVLADMFLPPENFGKGPSMPARSAGTKAAGSKAPIHKAKLTISGGPTYENGKVFMDFEASFSTKINSCLVELSIMSESGHLKADYWEDEGGLGKEFPLKLESMQIKKIKTGKKERPREPKNLEISDRLPASEFEGVSIEKIETKIWKKPFGAQIVIPKGEKYELHGQLAFSFSDSDVQPEISISEKRGE